MGERERERETGKGERLSGRSVRETGVREKDKKRFRVGERMIGRETGVVEGDRNWREKNKKRQEPERESRRE